MLSCWERKLSNWSSAIKPFSTSTRPSLRPLFFWSASAAFNCSCEMTLWAIKRSPIRIFFGRSAVDTAMAPCRCENCVYRESFLNSITWKDKLQLPVETGRQEPFRALDLWPVRGQMRHYQPVYASKSTGITVNDVSYCSVPARDPTQYRQHHAPVRQHRDTAAPDRTIGVQAGRQGTPARRTGLLGVGGCTNPSGFRGLSQNSAAAARAR